VEAAWALRKDDGGKAIKGRRWSPDAYEATIEKYGAAGEASTESAIRDLLTDLRHYCDQKQIDFDDSLEGSLDVYLEEQESADNERLRI
jgi:hypothetical protein